MVDVAVEHVVDAAAVVLRQRVIPRKQQLPHSAVALVVAAVADVGKLVPRSIPRPTPRPRQCRPASACIRFTTRLALATEMATPATRIATHPTVGCLR